MANEKSEMINGKYAEFLASAALNECVTLAFSEG
jgi:hypothetical protein